GVADVEIAGAAERRQTKSKSRHQPPQATAPACVAVSMRTAPFIVLAALLFPTVARADVLRPANLPVNAKTPVILSIGPYFNHSGQTGPAGPLENTPYT